MRDLAISGSPWHEEEGETAVLVAQFIRKETPDTRGHQANWYFFNL